MATPGGEGRRLFQLVLPAAGHPEEGGGCSPPLAGLQEKHCHRPSPAAGVGES